MIEFFVPGIPQPGGSKKAFINRKTGRPIITEDNKKSKDWKALVALFSVDKISEPLKGPIRVSFCFFLPRPRAHYGSGNNSHRIKDSSPRYPIVRPDCTKLIRSTEDALKGIAWFDDSQIVIQTAQKQYGNPGCHIRIWELNGPQSKFPLLKECL